MGRSSAGAVMGEEEEEEGGDTRLTEDVFAAATDHQRLRSQGGERTDEIGDVGAHGGDDGWIVQVERAGRGHHANGEIDVEGVD